MLAITVHLFLSIVAIVDYGLKWVNCKICAAMRCARCPQGYIGRNRDSSVSNEDTAFPSACRLPDKCRLPALLGAESWMHRQRSC